MRLIIGYGNPLRSDDGLGQYFAENIGQNWDVITSTQLMPEHAEPISRAEQVVFLDARLGETPGDVRCEMVTPIKITGAFTHNVTPASLLAAAQELYGNSPEAILISVSGSSFDYGDSFSPKIYALLPQIIQVIDKTIAKFSMAADTCKIEMGVRSDISV